MKKCKTCYYSEEVRVVDPVVVSLANNATTEVREFMENCGLSGENVVTKCHYAGKPQIVSGSEDWCHQWREK